jgi:hypothetical protein
VDAQTDAEEGHWEIFLEPSAQTLAKLVIGVGYPATLK